MVIRRNFKFYLTCFFVFYFLNNKLDYERYLLFSFLETLLEILEWWNHTKQGKFNMHFKKITKFNFFLNIV